MPLSPSRWVDRFCRRLLRSLLPVLLLSAWAPAQALCVAPLCSCTVSSTPLVFGAHDPLSGSASLATGSVAVRCTGPLGVLIPYDLGLGGGGSGNVGARRMSSGAAELPYELYRDAGRTQAWGNTPATGLLSGSILIELLGIAVTRHHTVYGRIPPGPVTAPPGNYVDTLTVVVTYY